MRELAEHFFREVLNRIVGRGKFFLAALRAEGTVEWSAAIATGSKR
jgi:hypothetical protein